MCLEIGASLSESWQHPIKIHSVRLKLPVLTAASEPTCSVLSSNDSVVDNWSAFTGAKYELNQKGLRLRPVICPLLCFTGAKS